MAADLHVGETRLDTSRDCVLTLHSVNEAGVVEYTRAGTFRGPIPGMDVPCLYAGFTHRKLWESWPLCEGEGS